MNKYIKPIVAAAVLAFYIVALRYVLPGNEPYFILGIGVVGFMAWLYGISAGLATAVLLVPVTTHVYGQFTHSTSYASFASSPAYIAMEILAAATLGRLRNKSMILSRKEVSLEKANARLQTVLGEVKELGGIHMLCTSCKNIQNDHGEWKRIDAFLMEETKAEFSHGMCPVCAEAFKQRLQNASAKN